jgi:hypothetical protein
VGARSSISSLLARVLGLFGRPDADQASGVKPLPKTMLRSLRDPKWISDDGYVSYEAFMDNPKTRESRAEKCKSPGTEVSVNWEDDSSVLEFTFRTRPKDVGVARLPTSEIYEQNKKPGSPDLMSVERDELKDNKYHGNIVYKDGLSRQHMRMIAGALAIASAPIKRPK